MPELPQGRLFQHFSFLDTNQVIVGHLDLDFDFGLYLSRVFLTVMVIPLRVKLLNPLASLGIQLQPSRGNRKFLVQEITKVLSQC
jgi:hypothetical protein